MMGTMLGYVVVTLMLCLSAVQTALMPTLTEIEIAMNVTREIETEGGSKMVYNVTLLESLSTEMDNSTSSAAETTMMTTDSLAALSSIEDIMGVEMTNITTSETIMPRSTTIMAASSHVEENDNVTSSESNTHATTMITMEPPATTTASPTTEDRLSNELAIVSHRLDALEYRMANDVIRVIQQKLQTWLKKMSAEMTDFTQALLGRMKSFEEELTAQMAEIRNTSDTCTLLSAKVDESENIIQKMMYDVELLKRDAYRDRKILKSEFKVVNKDVKEWSDKLKKHDDDVEELFEKQDKRLDKVEKLIDKVAMLNRKSIFDLWVEVTTIQKKVYHD